MKSALTHPVLQVIIIYNKNIRKQNGRDIREFYTVSDAHPG
jgi:hypothetical protein